MAEACRGYTVYNTINLHNYMHLFLLFIMKEFQGCKLYCIEKPACVCRAVSVLCLTVCTWSGMNIGAFLVKTLDLGHCE